MEPEYPNFKFQEPLLLKIPKNRNDMTKCCCTLSLCDKLDARHCLNHGIMLLKF